MTDRFGGTRIATSLEALLRSRHGTPCAAAIVVIASDGWDSDPPEALAAAMARLRRRAHRVIWVNPRAAAPGFSRWSARWRRRCRTATSCCPAQPHTLFEAIEAITRAG